MMRSISARIVALALLSADFGLEIEQAQASQGPGVMAGTASNTMQLAMAVVIYGGCAIVITTGFVMAARQRRTGS